MFVGITLAMLMFAGTVWLSTVNVGFETPVAAPAVKLANIKPLKVTPLNGLMVPNVPLAIVTGIPSGTCPSKSGS